MSRSFKQNTAFTLTELAVVLGVVGLVLGAIWLGYSYAMMAYHTSILGKDVSYILQGFTTNSFTGGDFPANAACHGGECFDPGTDEPSPGSNCDFGQSDNSMSLAAAQLGIAPGDLFSDPVTMVPLVNPWNNPFQINFETDGVCGGATGNATSSVSNRLAIDLGNMPVEACVHLLMANKETWIRYGLNQICTNNCGGTNAYFSGTDPSTTYATAEAEMTIENIAYWCSVSNPVDPLLYFLWPMQPN